MAGALMLTACGPTVPTELAMRLQQVDVKYGRPHKLVEPSPSPVPDNQPPPPFVFIPSVPTVEPVPPVVTPGPSPTPAPGCSKLAQFAVPKEPATPNIAAPPTQGGYAMRSGGTYSLGSTKGTLPAILGQFQPGQPVKGTDQVNGDYQAYGLVTAYDKTRYWAFTFDLAPNSPTTPGILLTSLHWHDPVRGDFDFIAPSHQPVQFVQTPLSIGNTWSSAGTDPFNQTSVSVSGSIPTKDIVNACGTPLDSYQVHISGNIVSPILQLTWTGDYDIGTQFGGLILGEHVILSGPDRAQNTGDMYAYDETSIINSAPPIPKP